MKWSLEHKNLTKDDFDNKVYAQAFVTLTNDDGVCVKVGEINHMIEYGQVSRSALMNTAYKLEQIAREMKSQAERMR